MVKPIIDVCGMIVLYYIIYFLCDRLFLLVFNVGTLPLQIARKRRLQKTLYGCDCLRAYTLLLLNQNYMIFPFGINDCVLVGCGLVRCFKHYIFNDFFFNLCNYSALFWHRGMIFFICPLPLRYPAFH